jgi:beta-phosphoglucomutase family hydrolase
VTPTRALIFDCDGTLADTMPLHWLAWRETTEACGLVFTEERFYAWGGMSTRLILDRLCQEQGVVIDIDRTAASRDEAFYRRANEVHPIDPVVEIVRRHRGDIPMAVASGGTRRQVETILGALGLADWFDAIVSAEDVWHPKPAPDVFLEAARRLGVEPARCTVYEDAEAGLDAARAAGMQVVDVRDLFTA